MSMRVAGRTISLGALGSRDFRWYLSGQLAASAIYQLFNVVQGWLIYHLTGSAYALGWVTAFWSISMIALSPFGGVVADRIDRRKLIIACRLTMAVNIACVVVLIVAGLIQVWHLALSSFLNGVVFAFMLGAETSLISDLVEPSELLSANAINAVGMGLTGIVFASAGGWLIAVAGPQAGYGVIVLLHCYAAFSYGRLPARPPASTSHYSPLQEMRKGLAYIKGNGLLMMLLIIAVVRMFFGQPYNSMLPAFSREALGLDATGLGALLSSVGLFLVGDMRRKGRALLIASMVAGLSLILVAISPSYGRSLVGLAITGGAINISMVLNMTLVMSTPDPAYRGRVMSIYMMQWALVSFGAMPAGALADVIGVHNVYAILGAFLCLFFGMLLVRRQDIQEMA